MNDTQKKVLYKTLISSLIFASLLAITANPHLPFESDQWCKSGIIQYMTSHSVFCPFKCPIKYRNYLFAGYYIISSILYKLIRAPIFGVMNYQSVLFGFILMFSLIYICRVLFNAPPLLTVFIFASMPVIITIFTYGNEEAVAFALFCLSLAFALIEHKYSIAIASILYVASLTSRPDTLLYFPFWLGMVCGMHKKGFLNKKNIYRRLFASLVTIGIFGVMYILFVIRLSSGNLLKAYQSNLFATPYCLHTNLYRVAALLIYPFCPVIPILACWGSVRLYKENSRFLLLMLTLLVTLVYHVQRRVLVSPKFIIGLSLFYGFLVIYLLQKVRHPMKLVLYVTIGLFWVFAINPWGIWGPASGAYWFLPTVDGPIPTGSYISFYKNCHDGFYQHRYAEPIKQIKSAVDILVKEPEKYVLIGRYGSFLMVQLIAKGVYTFDIGSLYYGQNLNKITHTSKKLLIDKRSLLFRYIPATTDEFNQWLDEYLKNGQIRGVKKDYHKHVVPDIMEIGPSVPLHSDDALAQRILFMNQYYSEWGAFSSTEWVPYYKPIKWIKNEGGIRPGTPLYEGKHFSCYDYNCDSDGEIYSLNRPMVYAKIKYRFYESFLKSFGDTYSVIMPEAYKICYKFFKTLIKPFFKPSYLLKSK